MQLRPIASIRWLTKLLLISLDWVSHLCPGLHAFTNFMILRRKIAAASIFRTWRFFVTSSFFSLTRRGFWIIQIVQKLSKVGTKMILCNLLFLFLIGLSRFPDGASEVNKFWENGQKSLSKRLVVLNDFSLLLCFVLTYGRGPPNSTNSAKSARNCSVSSISYFSLRLHHLAKTPM